MPSLEFIADMNISPLTVHRLRERGWKIVRVSEIMDARTSDIDILNYAQERNRVIISYDLDFSELLAIYGYDRPSLINLRTDDISPEYTVQRIVEVVTQLEKELQEGIVASVDDTSVRYRNLPIK
jgi:predicted nuclease of predicted toxin-antitoxin system